MHLGTGQAYISDLSVSWELAEVRVSEGVVVSVDLVGVRSEESRPDWAAGSALSLRLGRSGSWCLGAVFSTGCLNGLKGLFGLTVWLVLSSDGRGGLTGG